MLCVHVYYVRPYDHTIDSNSVGYTMVRRIGRQGEYPSYIAILSVRDISNLVVGRSHWTTTLLLFTCLLQCFGRFENTRIVVLDTENLFIILCDILVDKF